jgi:hypothetical protein
MNKSRWLNRELMINPYYYALCLNKKDFNYELKHLGIKKTHRPEFLLNSHCNATLHFLESKKLGSNCAIICLGNTDCVDKLQVYSLLVHEAVHLWQHIKEHIGEHIPSNEFEAYSIQAISQNLMYSYKEQIKKLKK